jgi:hypothetical protein
MNENKTASRRNFLKTAGLGLAVASGSYPLMAAIKSDDISNVTSRQSLADFNFEFLSKGDNFLGIGQIMIGDVLLRSNKLPMFAQITTPEGQELVNLKISNKIYSNELILIEFTGDLKEADTMEWMLHTVRNRRNMTDWTKAPEPAGETTLKLIIKPVERMVGNKKAIGFSYQYQFKSDQYSIYKITDRSSWEIGGSSIGNKLWMRNGVVDSIVQFSNLNDFYSTEWYLPGIANPNIFQFHPLQTQLQGFTYTASREGTLITWATEVSHIRSLFEKWRDYDQIVHFHEHCNDLSNELKTSPVEVLWIAGELSSIEHFNRYNDMRELVHEELHKQIGMKRERITTYGIIEEHTEPDFEEYTSTILPKMLDTGVKTVFIPSQCQNDMNVWGVSNMCCNVDFKIADAVGEDKLKKFCDQVKSAGAKVEMWGNTAISTLIERFMHQEGKPKGIQFLPYKNSIMEVIDHAESPFVRNASNAIEADHYTPRFCALNLRDETIRAYWMKQWKHFYDYIGIEGIFLDSSFNMSSDKFHHAQFDGSKSWEGATLDQKDLLGKFRPQHEPPKLIHSQYHAHLSLMVEMQKTGYQYCAEDMGVFGINRTGPDMLSRINSLPIWSDSYCRFNETVLKDAGYEPMDIFFKALAYRMMWYLFWSFRKNRLDLGTENPLAYTLLKVYNQVTDFMYNREILTNENGVVYRSGKSVVLWAFEDFDFSVENIKSITNVMDGRQVINAGKDFFRASRLVVYKMEYA